MCYCLLKRRDSVTIHYTFFKFKYFILRENKFRNKQLKTFNLKYFKTYTFYVLVRIPATPLNKIFSHLNYKKIFISILPVAYYNL